MSQSKYAPTTWGGTAYTELETPSGQLCLVRKLQPMDLVAGEVLGQTNFLAEIVQAEITRAKAGPQDHRKPAQDQKSDDTNKLVEALEKAVSTPDGLDSMIDAVVVKTVVEPSIEIPPKDYTDRKEGVVYVDTINFGDKMFIFNWAMSGLDKLKRFRSEPTGDVEDLEPGKDVQRQAE